MSNLGVMAMKGYSTLTRTGASPSASYPGHLLFGGGGGLTSLHRIKSANSKPCRPSGYDYTCLFYKKLCYEHHLIF